MTLREPQDAAAEQTPAPTATPTAIDPVPGAWQRVSPKYVIVDLLSTLVTAVIATGVTSIAFWVTREPLLLVIPGVVLALHVLYAVFIPRRVRALGYRLRDDDLVFRKGIMFLRVVAVPYGRMQLVDINRGPLARAFGLSELKLVTAAAASNITIPGLTEADAESLRDRLVELAESRRAGL